MKMYTAPKFSIEQKLKAIKLYHQKGGSLRNQASSLGISYMTLWRWVHEYKINGEEVFKKIYKKSSRRFSNKIEQKIVMFKERNPAMSIANARSLLRMDGLVVSAKGIWSVWHRYGLLYANHLDPLDPFNKPHDETLAGIKNAKSLLYQGDQKSAAKVLNNLPSMVKDEILIQVPEKFLSPRRKLERFYMEGDKMPPPSAMKKAHQIRRLLEKSGYIYSSIFVTFVELYNLHNMGMPHEMFNILKNLKRKIYKIHNRSWRILYYSFMALAFHKRNKYNKYLYFANKCSQLRRIPSYPWHLMTLGSLYTHMDNYMKAFHYYEKGFEMSNNKELHFALDMVLHGYCRSGDYITARKLLKKVSESDELRRSTSFNLSRAYMAFGEGDLNSAERYFLEVLNMSSKYNLSNHLRASLTGLAFVASALNKKNEARAYLERCIPFLQKQGNTQELHQIKLNLALLGGCKLTIIRKRMGDYLHFLLFQAKKRPTLSNYRKALNYATRHRLLGYFERIVTLAPEPVLHMIEQGKNPGLSVSVLKLPVFNQSKIVYHVKFLGSLTVLKNGQ